MITPLLTRESCRSYIEERLFEPVTYSDEILGQTGRIGIELEIFSCQTDKNSKKGVKPIPLFGKEGSLINALLSASKSFGGIAKVWNPDNRIKGYPAQVEQIKFPDGDSFLFEPGGQIEISTALCNNMQELQAHLTSKQEILKIVTQNSGFHFAQFGTNPWFDVNEIKNQLHKPRYHALEKYFDNIGQYGKQMMLQTGSLHINLDLGHDPATRVKRIVAANLLVPFVTAMFANSSIVEGKKSGYKSYRSFIWQQLDARRTGILAMDKISKTMDKDDLIDVYLEFALKAPLIYIDELGDCELPDYFTLEYWIANPIQGIKPDSSHLANHFSLLFPEVRLKGYLEIRSVDAPPVNWQWVPVMFYTGLLYSNTSLEQVLELLLPFSSCINEFHREATYGLLSDEIFDISKKLMTLAIDGFSGLPDDFKKEQHVSELIRFFDKYTNQRRTFADDNPEQFLL